MWVYNLFAGDSHVKPHRHLQTTYGDMIRSNPDHHKFFGPMHQYDAYRFEEDTGALLRDHLTTFEDPTLLVFSVGSNDIRKKPGRGTVEKLTERLTDLLDKMSYFEGLALVVVAPVPDLFDDTFETTREVTQSWKGLCAKHWPWVAFVDSQEVLRGGVDDPLPDFTFFEEDGYHLNERGARLMAHELKNVVTNIPTRVFGRRTLRSRNVQRAIKHRGERHIFANDARHKLVMMQQHGFTYHIEEEEEGPPPTRREGTPERVVQLARPPIKLKRLNWKPRNRGVERRRGKDRERPVVPPGKVRAAGFRWPKKEPLPKLVSRQARTGRRSVKERLS